MYGFFVCRDKKVAIVERWPLTCREVAVSRGSTVVFQENKDGD